MNFFESTVRVLSAKGHGVVDHPDGRIFFVPGLWVGESARFELTGSEKNYDVLIPQEILRVSRHRVQAPCPHHGIEKCGGCPWMSVTYSAQLEAKEQKIDFLLSKNNLSVAQRDPIIASNEILGYRNRAQFKTDGTRIGYVTEGTNHLYAVDDCHILNSKMRQLFHSLRDRLPQQDWVPTPPHPWNYLDVDDLQSPESIELNRRRPFRQGNSLQNEKMKSWIRDVLAAERKDYPVIEAFCGSGNLTEALSSVGFTNILASEVRGVAVEELRARALPGVRIMEIDMNAKGVWQQLAKRQPHAKILLLDPPREGIEKRRGLFKYLDNLQTVVYISCDPNTWARDVKDFQSQGWRIESLTPIDLFPHTPHIELMSVLRLQ